MKLRVDITVYVPATVWRPSLRLSPFAMADAMIALREHYPDATFIAGDTTLTIGSRPRSEICVTQVPDPCRAN